MQQIFTGISYHTLDNKNRLFLPQKYRVGNKYVLTYGIDGCIEVYPFEKWHNIVKKIETISLKNKTYQRTFIRTFFAEAEILSIDKQGRLLIPQKFKDKFEIENEVVVVGNRNKIEIWAKKTWEKYYKDASKILNMVKSQIDI